MPLVLFNQFKFFFNMFFLLIALSQFVKALRVGFLFTFVAPLAFVLLITMIKEAADDIARRKRDREINLKKYHVWKKGVWKETYAQNLRVGTLLKVHHNERVPADLILLYTSEKQGTVFIRTDQLDGETDWKLRRAVNYIQEKHSPDSITSLMGDITCNPPTNMIYDFEGVYDNPAYNVKEPLYLEHTLWANTVLASSGYIIGMIAYTGKETRAEMNNQLPRQKVGLLDNEINFLSKILFILMLFFSGTIVVLNGFHGNWGLTFFRYVLLLCSIIPISLRVNLDLAKIWYSKSID